MFFSLVHNIAGKLELKRLPIKLTAAVINLSTVFLVFEINSTWVRNALLFNLIGFHRASLVSNLSLEWNWLCPKTWKHTKSARKQVKIWTQDVANGGDGPSPMGKSVVGRWKQVGKYKRMVFCQSLVPGQLVRITLEIVVELKNGSRVYQMDSN